MGEGKIGLAETVEALRTELSQAMSAAANADVQFPLGSVELQFQVGVTTSGEGRGGVKFWVVELGGGAGWARESVQTVTITLESPIDRHGRSVRIVRGQDERP